MTYERVIDKDLDLSNLAVISNEYRENTKSLSDQINLLIEISDTLSKILDLFETD